MLTSLNLSQAAYLLQPADWQNQLLGAVRFSGSGSVQGFPLPHIDVPMRVLDYQPASKPPVAMPTALCEAWHTDQTLQEGQSGDIHYRYDGSVLFGVIHLNEHVTPTGSSPLQHTTEQAYQQIFTLLDALDYPHVYRFWNYMAQINSRSHDLERYRQFNLGRQAAFMTSRRDIAGNVPAACALGTAEGPLSIAFLAGRPPAVAIENPRQLSACDYPPDYGPRSPVFSRASLVQLDRQVMLFISGTASIVGHATLHPQDVAAQTHETMTNIEAIINAANHESAHVRFTLAQLFYRVYIRHEADLKTIQAVLQARIGSGYSAVFLQADVCRQDLLVEIEANLTVPFA
jgi:enamine deaminase RidA (YjgF/YER057c/UK114 family)